MPRQRKVLLWHQKVVSDGARQASAGRAFHNCWEGGCNQKGPLPVATLRCFLWGARRRASDDILFGRGGQSGILILRLCRLKPAPWIRLRNLQVSSPSAFCSSCHFQTAFKGSPGYNSCHPYEFWPIHISCAKDLSDCSIQDPNVCLNPATTAVLKFSSHWEGTRGNQLLTLNVVLLNVKNKKPLSGLQKREGGNEIISEKQWKTT